MRSKIIIVSAVAAALAVVTVLSGCNTSDAARDNGYAANAVLDESARLSEDDYRERVTDAFGKWSSEVAKIAGALFGAEGSDISQIPDSLTHARAALNEFNTFLPPKKLDSLHNDLLLNIDIERKWLDAAEKAADAKQKGDAGAFGELSEELKKYGDESKLPSTVLEVLKALREPAPTE